MTFQYESKRVKRLRCEIIAAIPKFPNNRETKTKLEEMYIGDLLIHYLSWMSRYVSIKPRKIIIRPAVTSDPRWPSLKLKIGFLLEKVRKGLNLTPHLSRETHSRGYAPAASEKGPDIDRWADKDFLLNVMGFHHFHLGIKLDTNGHVERTDEVLFAMVSRELFAVMGLFDHSVFSMTEDDMSPERRRLWNIFESRATWGVPPGTVVVPSFIAMSGHPLHLVTTADDYSRCIREIDPKLEDRLFIEELYDKVHTTAPRKPKLEWVLNFSDLGIQEKNSNRFFILRRGFN